jgi:HK97 family phage portal protein
MWSFLLGAVGLRQTREPRTVDEHRVGYQGRTLAGVRINADTAMQVPAVWACVRYISQTVAVLPWRAMRETPQGGVAATSHQVDFLLHKRASSEWSSFQFRETLTSWALRHGNGYAEIEWATNGMPFALHPIHPDRVDVKRDLATGRLYYEVSNGADPKSIIEAEDMFHIRGFGDGPVGVNVIEYAAQSIGWAAAAQLFGASFFGEGMNVTGVVQVKNGLKGPGLARLKAELKKLYKGVRGERTAILDAGMEWKSVQIDPEKAQFLQTNQHMVEEICRWFGVPPHKVMHLLRGTFSNIEHQSIEVVVDSISPWAKRFEDEADYKLFGQNRRGYYTKMNMNALLRGDMKARMEFYKGMQYVGAFSPNRVLELEDEKTIGPEGDIHVMQSQFVPLKQIGAEPVTPPAPGVPADIEQRDARLREFINA